MSDCKVGGCYRYHLKGSKYCKKHYEEMMAKWDFEKLKREADAEYYGLDKTEAHSLQMKEHPTSDNVNHPSHYGQGKIEAIEYISDFLTPEEYQGYLRGNIAKYLHRWPYKNKVEDLRKAAWYLDRLIKEAEGA
jgi:hypothetical protein